MTGTRLTQDRGRATRALMPHIDLLAIDLPAVINSALADLLAAAVLAPLTCLWARRHRRSAPRRRGRR